MLFLPSTFHSSPECTYQHSLHPEFFGHLERLSHVCLAQFKGSRVCGSVSTTVIVIFREGLGISRHLTWFLSQKMYKKRSTGRPQVSDTLSMFQQALHLFTIALALCGPALAQGDATATESATPAIPTHLGILAIPRFVGLVR